MPRTPDLSWARKNWPIKDGRWLAALRLIPGDGEGAWYLLPGLCGVERCLGCCEWVPIWRWALHEQGPGEHWAPEHGLLARLRAEAKADADRTERTIREHEGTVARYAIKGPSQLEKDML